MSDRLVFEQIDAETLRFRVRVTPGSKRASVGGNHDGSLKVTVTQPPENGKANHAVIKAVAKQFGISKSCVEIVSGQTSRVKTIQVSGTPAADAAERLTALASSPGQ